MPRTTTVVVKYGVYEKLELTGVHLKGCPGTHLQPPDPEEFDIRLVVDLEENNDITKHLDDNDFTELERLAIDKLN